MSAIAILMVLLVLAFFGNMLVGGRAVRGFGLPSGTEFLLLGIVAGPKALGVISGTALRAFEPISVVALSWTALGAGLEYGNASTRRIPARRLVVATVCGLATFLLVAGAVGISAWFVADVRGRDLLVLSLGAGCAGTETTRFAVRWVSERHRARGPLAELVTDIAASDALVPLMLLSLVWALGVEAQAGPVAYPWWVGFGIPFVLGSVLGATSTALTDAEARAPERWGLLLGAALLGIGAAMRLRASPLTTMFTMGLTVSALSRQRDELRSMLALAERPVMLPVLVVAGASVALPNLPHFYVVIAGAIVARFVGKLWAGFALRTYEMPTASSGLGFGLLSSGSVTLMIGLSCAIRFTGPIGDAILAFAACSTVIGETVGPVMLRRELMGAGEVQTPEPTPVDLPDGRLSMESGRRSFAPTRSRRRITSHPDEAS